MINNLREHTQEKAFLVLMDRQGKFIHGHLPLQAAVENNFLVASQILEVGLVRFKVLQNVDYFLVKIGIILFRKHHNVILRIVMVHHIIHLQHMVLLPVQDLAHHLQNFGKLIYVIMMLKKRH